MASFPWTSLSIARPRSLLKLLAAWIFLFIFLTLYGKARFFRDPGSIFYDEDRAYVRKYTNYRLARVDEFITNQIAASDLDPPQPVVKASAKPKICAQFATVKRDGQQYIDEAVGSILEGLAREEREDLYVSVYFANTDPTVHPSYNQTWLHRVVDEVHSLPQDNLELLSKMKEYENKGDFKRKGVADYVYGLRHCYDKEIPYVLMFEGDVVAAEGWFAKTLDAVDRIQNVYLKNPRDWIYLRLFNQEPSIGWASNKIGDNNEHWISLGIAVGVIALVAILRRCRVSMATSTDNGSVVLICVLVIPSIVVFFFQAGKANVLPPRPGVFAQNFGCCSQALVFPREQIPDLISFLERRGRGQVDLMVNEHARNEQLTRYSLYPVQVQHVGIQSSRKTKADEARTIWSMAFEDKKPDAVRKEHLRLVDSIYHNGKD